MKYFSAVVECLISPNWASIVSVQDVVSPLLQLKMCAVDQDHLHHWGICDKFWLSDLFPDHVNEFLPVWRITLVHMLIKIWGVLDEWRWIEKTEKSQKFLDGKFKGVKVPWVLWQTYTHKKWSRDRDLLNTKIETS